MKLPAHTETRLDDVHDPGVDLPEPETAEASAPDPAPTPDPFRYEHDRPPHGPAQARPEPKPVDAPALSWRVLRGTQEGSGSHRAVGRDETRPGVLLVKNLGTGSDLLYVNSDSSCSPSNGYPLASTDPPLELPAAEAVYVAVDAGKAVPWAVVIPVRP